MDLVESLSVKSIPVKFQKCERRESIYILLTVAGRYLQRHQVFENVRLRLVSVPLCDTLKSHCGYCMSTYENHSFTAVTFWNLSNSYVPKNIILKYIVQNVIHL